MKVKTNNKWKKVQLGDIIEICGGGTPSTKNKRYWGGDIPWLTPKEITNYNGRFIKETEKYITSEGLEKSSAQLIEPNSILMTSRATIGNPIINLVPMATNQGFINIKCKNVDTMFFFYWIKANKQLILNNSHGTTFGEIIKSIFKIIETEIPDKNTQEKITFIISNFDNLIENYHEQIDIYEKISNLIYMKLIIEKDFNGIFEHLNNLNDWKEKPLSQISKIIMGQSPKSEFYNKKGIGLHFHQGVTDFGQRFPKDRIFCTKKKRVAEKGDVLLSVRAPVGRLNIANKKIIIGRGLAAIRENNGYQNFLFLQLKNIFKKEDMMGGGTVFKAVTRNDVENIKCIIPPKLVLEFIENLLKPFSDLIENLTEKIEILTKIRDKLINALFFNQIDLDDIRVEKT